MTPDEYCDSIIGIAFDRETTKEAFEAGRLAEAAEHAQDLTVAYMDGHARGRESFRRELEKQEPVANINWDTLRVVVHPMPPPKATGTWEALYVRPVPSPDVRELVEALRLADLALCGMNANLDEVSKKVTDALEKWESKE